MADTIFDRDFRFFARSVVDAEGKAAPRVLAEGMANTLPNALVDLTWTEEADKARSLLVFIRGRTDLSFDPALLAALDASATALASAAAVADHSELALSTARLELRKAVRAFDKGYARLVRALGALLDEETFRGIVPMFPDGPTADDDLEPADGTAPVTAEATVPA